MEAFMGVQTYFEVQSFNAVRFIGKEMSRKD